MTSCNEPFLPFPCFDACCSNFPLPYHLEPTLNSLISSSDAMPINLQETGNLQPSDSQSLRNYTLSNFEAIRGLGSIAMPFTS